MGVETSYDQSCDGSAIFCPEGARTTLACYVRATCEQPAPSKVIVQQSHDGPTCLPPSCALLRLWREKLQIRVDPGIVKDLVFIEKYVIMKAKI